MTDADLARLPYAELLDAVASSDPAPGGGAGAALAGALGAALVAMVGRAGKDSPKVATQKKLLEAVVEGADEARARLLDCATADAKAFGAVIAALRMPRDDEAQKEARAKALEAAFKAATESPLRIMENLLEVIGLAKNAVESGLPDTAPDGATGAEICRAALKSCALQVRANLGSIEDETFVKLARTRMDEMAYMGTRVCTNIESFVNDLLK